METPPRMLPLTSPPVPGRNRESRYIPPNNSSLIIETPPRIQRSQPQFQTQAVLQTRPARKRKSRKSRKNRKSRKERKSRK
jgi:hypothetical protein